MEAAFEAGFASALLDVLFTKVTEVLCSEVGKFCECNQNLLKLKTTTVEAISALKKIDTSEMEGDTKLVVEETVRALTRLLLDGEDLMEDIAELIKRNPHSDEGSALKVMMKSSTNLTKPRNIYNLEKKMVKILEPLKKVLKELNQNPEFKKGECSNRNHFNSTTDSLFGREDDVKEIMDHLLSTTSKYDGVSILGIDGLGKTSLAKTIEKKAGAHFVVLWVSVPGGDFNLSEIFNRLNQLQSAKQLLVNSSVLIIFDNLLKVALGDWFCMVSEIRRDGINGTTVKNIKFLITTFIPEVVLITHTTSHYLKPLRDQDCEKVIIATLQSMGRDLSKSSFTENVISSLAKNSKGLSSVACLLGQFVAQFDAERVRKMLTEDLWDSDDFRNHIFPVIKSSYSGFKPELKRYLAYFSLFPPTYHYAFTVDELVHLWVAEGFTHHPLGIPNTITLGIKHFHELQGMSIIRLSDQTTQNGMETYELNQFSYIFARLAASTTCVSLAQGVSASKYTRHVFWCDSNDCPPKWKDIKSKSLRTFFAQSNSKIDKIPHNAFKELTRLRVLSLSGTDVSELPGSIKLLRRLRYLNISRTQIKSLPDTLCKLTALQFLKFTNKNHQGGRGLVCLPEEFANLTSMIYLDWDKSDIKRMTGLPPNIGKLTTLQTLPLYFVGVEDGHHISELKDMNQLRGSICINNLENVKDLDPSRLPLLDQKQFEEIELEWTKPNINRNDQDVLGCLKPWDYLKELKITNYHGYKFPNWMTDSSFQLEKLHLNTCPNVQGFLEKGSLPNLKVLVLEKLNNVVKIDSAFFGEGSFPKLESLKILHMEKLQAWNVGPSSNVMPCLQVIQFTCCPKLRICSVEHQSSLEHFEILRCEALTSLPDLPASLKKLIVEESDLLTERCKYGGADWTKVNRIPKVEIDFVEITTSGSISVTTLPGQQAQNSVGKGMKPKLSKVSTEPQIWRAKIGREMGEVLRDHMKDHKLIQLSCILFEDHEFDKNTLIQIWIASGLIWGVYKDFIGNMYFEILLSHAYIVHSTTCYPNETKLYKVDVKRLLDRFEDMKDKELYLTLKDGRFEGSKHVQHLALVGDAVNEHSLNGVKKFKDLKTLILFPEDGPNINTIPDDLFALKLLEVLDLSRTQIKELSDLIANLVDLRYLDLSFTLIELLPETIVCLSKLQTLKLNDCRRLLRLPEGTSKLTSLEHLEVDVVNQLPFLPKGIGSLERLKGLSAFMVHVDEGRSIKELKNMKHLTGRLCISDLQNVLHNPEAEEANLKNKDKLTELELRWDESQHSCSFSESKVLELLHPSFQLEKLQISYCDGSYPPYWLEDTSFDKLTSIILFKCKFMCFDFSLAGLPSLKCLTLIDMVFLGDILEPQSQQDGVIDASCAFPKLEKLTIVNAPGLRIWHADKDWDINFPKLHELILERCQELWMLPSPVSKLRVLKHLQVINCRDLESFLDKELPTTLVTLIIEDCPKINKWIQKNTSDWRKNIEHVEDVYIIDQDEDREDEDEEDELSNDM